MSLVCLDDARDIVLSNKRISHRGRHGAICEGAGGDKYDQMSLLWQVFSLQR
jgi:hypothetical protein